MAIALRQSTASQEVPLGYFLDSTDGDSEETGLTIANTDIKIWKAGATTLANKNSGGATHISNGIYYAVLDATDSDTVGPLVIFVHVSGALPVRLECHVYEETVYDAFFAASAAGEFAVKLSTQGKADVNTEADTALAEYDPPTHAELVSEINDVQSDIAGLNDLDAAGVRTAVGLASANLDTQLSTIDGNVDSILVDTGTTIPGTITTVDTVVDAIKAKTDSLTFTQAGRVDSNITHVNEVEVGGAGTEGDPWGPV